MENTPTASLPISRPRSPLRKFIVAAIMQVYLHSAVFSQNKNLKGRISNILGLQVFRVLVARGLLQLRRLILFRDYPRRFPECATLQRDGIVVIPNFLRPDQFEALKAEFDQTYQQAQVRNAYAGRYNSEVNKIDFKGGIAPPLTSAFFDHPLLNALLEFGEARKVNRFKPRWSGRVNCWFERILHAGETAEKFDPQILLHRDTFFSTHKVIFYMSDVTLEDGPYTYVKGSQRLSLKRLTLEYKNSIKKTPDSSIRAPLSDPKYHKMQEYPVIGKRNTLVITDVFGFHRRGDAHQGRIRETIRMSVRSNPFL